MNVADKIIVNVDVDSVIYPFTEALRLAMVEEIEASTKGRVTRKHFPDGEMWDLAKWQWRAVVESDWWEAVYEVEGSRIPRLMFTDPQAVFGNTGLAPVPGSRIVLRKLSEHENVFLRAVTSKMVPGDHAASLSRITATARWLESVPEWEFDEIIFTGAAGKSHLGADVIIDDSPFLDGWVQEGSTNLLFDQPWNRGVRLESVQRVLGWLSAHTALSNALEARGFEGLW